MPRIDFTLWDRFFILKLICAAQMTYSSFIVLLYLYMIILQSWTAPESERKDVMEYKWSVLAVSLVEFATGIVLAFASNMRGIHSISKKGIVVWIILETLIIPVAIFLLWQLFSKLVTSKQQYSTDRHYSRVNIVHICLLLSQYLFIGYALDLLVSSKKKVKTYDPRVRPEIVDAPTDPQITTTESRHIRLSQSFLSQPSSSKRHKKKSDEGIASLSKDNKQIEEVQIKQDED